MGLPRDNPTARSGRVSRRFKAVLIAYLTLVSIYVIFDIVTEGLGKSTAGPIFALIIGVIVWFRERGTILQ